MADRRLLQSLTSVLIVVELGVLWAPAPIKVVAGLTLGLVLPGFVATRLLGRLSIAGVERLLLVPGLSVAIAIVTGLCLTAAHIHLRTASWAIALGLVTAAGLAVLALLEQRKPGKKEPGGDHFWRSLGPVTSTNLRIHVFAASLAVRRLRLKRPNPAIVRAPAVMIGAIGLTLALAVGGAVAVSGSTEHYHGRGFTELWALPDGTSAVRLGVISHELHAVTYRIRVSVDGDMLRDRAVALRPSQTWQFVQPISGGGLVNVALQKSPGGPTYRRVSVRVG
jgi:hypothetical protein